MMFTTTQGVSVIMPRPIFSIIREKPGPEVAVMALAPPQEAPRMAAMEAISSSIWMHMPLHLGQPFGHALGDFGGRGDGITGKKTATGGNGALGAGFVAVDKKFSR